MKNFEVGHIEPFDRVKFAELLKESKEKAQILEAVE